MPDTEFLFVSHYVESIASQCQSFCFAFWNNLSTPPLPTALPSEELITPVIIILACPLCLLKTMWAIYTDRLSWCTANIPAILRTVGPKRKAEFRNLAVQFKSQLTTKGQYMLSKWIIAKLRQYVWPSSSTEYSFCPRKPRLFNKQNKTKQKLRKPCSRNTPSIDTGLV